MNKETFIQNVDTSGKMFRKNYLEKYFPEILQEIIIFINTYNLDEIPFNQQVYHWYNDIKEYKKCYCGNKVQFKNSTIGYYEYCSKECMNKSNKVKTNRANTNINKFGFKTPSENLSIKNKIINTNLEKYGEKSPILNKNIKNKSQETLKKNYGVDNPLKSKEILNKVKNSLLDKYSVDNPKKSETINNKIKKTMLSRYGVEYALQNTDIKNKAKEKQLLTLSKIIREYYKEYNIIEIDNKNKVYKIECDKGHVFEIDYVLLNSRRRINTLICTECNPVNKSISGLEIELFQFIESNYNSEILIKDKSLIDKELDIYLPQLNIAFEFNGLWWHNELNKTENFHLEKTELCHNKNVQLFHIWEDDWLYKKEIVKSMILNRLGKIQNKIYARKCEIKQIKNPKLIRDFLNNNHIQGYTTSKINIGLYYNNDLVSLMTFGKKRIVMSHKNVNNEWELNRFCNKVNTNIIGGASKLFKYFIENYNPIEIITYANRSYSIGKLYYKLGFEYIHKTKPNYYYVVDKIRKHRFSFRKNFLIRKGFDPKKTEHEIMLERKIYRIYDSGQLKFIWKNKNL